MKAREGGFGMKAAEDAEPSADALLRHYLRALSFRLEHVLASADAAFGDFDAGQGARTPSEIVRHLSGLIVFVGEQYGGPSRAALPALGWQAERDRFRTQLRALEALLGAGAARRGPLSAFQLWQGPLADAMTHVGQLALLRRLAGAPSAPVRYWQADLAGDEPG